VANPTPTTRECPVCDRRQAERLHSQRFVLPDEKNLAAVYDVVVCVRCGAAFADTPVSQRRYDELYARQSRYAAGPAAHASDNDRDTARFQEMAAEIARILPARNSRILDIGCANGQMLAALSALGYTTLCGTDPSPACVEQAGAIPGVRAHVGSLSSIPKHGAPYDLVILSHVLEHVRDVKPAFQYVKRFMSDGALLYVEVPDASRYAQFAWSPFQDFNSEHINHFSLASLTNLLRQCGLLREHAAAKNILSAPGMPYPAIYAFACVDKEGPAAIEKDLALKGALLEYVRVSTRLMADIDARLTSTLGGGAPVIVWGTGELTAKLLADTVLARANVVGFVDSNPINQGRLLRGLPIQAPADLKSGDEIIVAASILHYASIVQAIRALGLRNPVLGLMP
jgi:SAM-dependent methyltransferase